MKLLMFCILVFALAINSCAQQQKRKEDTTSKNQSKQVATQKTKMSIEGMVCNACQSSVKKTIKALDGVKDVEVSLEHRNAIVTYYSDLITPELIQQAVNKGGFTAGKPEEVNK